MDEWFLEIRLGNKFDHSGDYRRRVNLTSHIIRTGMSPQLKEEMDIASSIGVSAVPMDQMVHMMKTREIRREVFIDAARQLAGQLADYLQDEEGWHGKERSERVAELQRRK